MVILFESSTEIQQTRESIQNPSPLEALKARSEPSRDRKFHPFWSPVLIVLDRSNSDTKASTTRKF